MTFQSQGRLTNKSDLVCNLELDWNNDGKVCRDLVQNNPESIRKHMIKKHGFKKIPELAQRECKNSEDEQEKYKLYLTNPEEWFFNNQYIYREIRNFHFRRVGGKKIA